MSGRSSTEGDTPAGARDQNETDAFSGARTLDTEISSDAKLKILLESASEKGEKFFRSPDGKEAACRMVQGA